MDDWVDDSSNADGGGEGGYTGSADGGGYTGYDPGPNTDYSSASAPIEPPAPPYQGPAIGPLSEEQYQKDKAYTEEYWKEQHRKARELGIEDDPNESGSHTHEEPEFATEPGEGVY